MNEALGGVLALALAIAASPFPIVPVILLLLTPRPRATAGAFLLGWVVGILGVAVVFSFLAAVLEKGETPTWASWTRIVLGLALVGMGVAKWRGRGADTEPPAWMASLETAGPGSALRLALLLSVANPKVLLLSAAAGLAIGAEPLDLGEFVAVVALFTAVAASSVALPVLLHLVFGDRMLGPLRRTKDWLTVHNAAVLAVVAAVIGLALVAKGWGEL